MNVRRMLALAGLWLLSLGLVGYAASQARAVYPQGPEREAIVSGDNLGFRLEGHQGQARTGTLVVKVDGTWVEARSSVKVIPVK